MKIDVHSHIGFEDKLQQQTKEQLLKIMQEGGIDHCVTFPFGGIEDYAQLNEEFSLLRKEKGLIPFGRINHLHKNALQEVENIVSLDLKGIKIHTRIGPLTRAPDLLRAIEKTDLPILVHTGNGPNELVSQLEKVQFNGRLIIGHGGKGQMKAAAKLTQERENFFIETSLLSIYGTSLLIDNAPIEKILLGSDAPFSHPTIELFKLQELAKRGVISEEDLALISGKNYLRSFRDTL